MKKFKIIEEGRLDNCQMEQIEGGKLTCTVVNGQIYQQPSGPGGPAFCPGRYKSCSDGYKLTCNRDGGFLGQPGGAGVIDDSFTYLLG